jgi:hypothetical protein
MSLPEPQPGLVFRYSYLWHNENMTGQEEGIRDRPCTVIMVAAHEGGKRVMAIPLTRTQPANTDFTVKIPDVTKRRLGLDNARVWAICSEVNEFIWTVPDVRPLPKAPLRYEYGFLPPKIFNQIKAKIQFCANGKTLRVVARSG